MCTTILNPYNDVLYAAGSPLFFGQLKVMIFVAAMSAVVAIIKKVKMKVRYKMIWVAMSGFCVLISIANTQDTRLIISMLAMILGAVYDVHELITGAFVAKLVTFVLVMLSGGYSHINGCALHGGVVMLLYIAVVGSKLTKKYSDMFVIVFGVIILYKKWIADNLWWSGCCATCYEKIKGHKENRFI